MFKYCRFFCITLFFYLISLMPLNAAEDHLVPDVPFLVGIDDYALELKKLFKGALEDNVVFRVLITDSFRPEAMVGIRQEEQKLFAFCLVANQGVNHYLIDKSSQSITESTSETITDNRKDLSLQTHERELSREFVDRVAKVLGNELLLVQHGTPELALDGIEYQFVMFVKRYGMLSGRLGSVEKKPKMNSLVELVNAISLFSKGDIDEQRLNGYLIKLESYQVR